MQVVIIKTNRTYGRLARFDPFPGQSFKGRSGLLIRDLGYIKYVELDNPIKGFISGTDQEVHEAHWWFTKVMLKNLSQFKQRTRVKILGAPIPLPLPGFINRPFEFLLVAPVGS